jgi:hypothetical protein
VRFTDGGDPLVFEVAPQTRGLLGLGNGPAPGSVSVLNVNCDAVATARLMTEGGTLITIEETGGEVHAEAAPVPVPREIADPALVRSQCAPSRSSPEPDQ